jgi:hypothetical protein
VLLGRDKSRTANGGGTVPCAARRDVVGVRSLALLDPVAVTIGRVMLAFAEKLRAWALIKHR